MLMDNNQSKNRNNIWDINISNLLIEFSIPLIFGVVLALIWANSDYLVFNYQSYIDFIKRELIPGFTFLGHEVSFYFIVNDIFMVFFFGIATVEIVHSLSSGGPLNPINKSINPLFATMGGVIAPVGMFFILASTIPVRHLIEGEITYGAILNGWGIPTATDIALAWLFAGMILGRKHPAISFLLLLAIADDAIGLVIIAIFYPSAEFSVQPQFLLINLVAISIAYFLRRMKVKDVGMYLIFAGIPSWLGLMLTHVHPALALVPIIPFLPSSPDQTNSLHEFEIRFKVPVDLGLFFFGIANAGVLISGVNEITWIIFLSLFLGKPIGIFFFSFLAKKLFGFPFPDGVDKRSLFIVGLIAGTGLTVALFVAGQAYTEISLQGPAKMGALLSVLCVPVAFILAKILRVKVINK